MENCNKNKNDVGGRQGVVERGGAIARVSVGQANAGGSTPQGALSRYGSSGNVSLEREHMEEDYRSSSDNLSLITVGSDMEAGLSECSVVLEPLPAQFRRKGKVTPGKRPHTEDSGSESASGDEAASPRAVVVTAKRGRGRPPSTGKYVGHAKAIADLKAMKREEFLRQAEEEVAAKVARHKATRKVAPPKELQGEKSGLAHELNNQIVDATNVILEVVNKSGNLKGTCQKALKMAADSIKVAAEGLYGNSVSEETRKLQADNIRLRTEMAELRKELAELRAKVLRAPEHTEEETPMRGKTSPFAPTNPASSSVSQPEELVRLIMQQVGGMINARFEGMEDRLLPEKRIRPPLAADQRQKPAQEPASQTRAAESRPTEPKKAAKKKAKKPVEGTATTQDPREGQPAPPANATAEEGWSTVTKRGKKANKAKAAAPKKDAKAKQGGTARSASKPLKLRTPKTAAVVITLQPGAAEKGVTYANVLADAKSKIDLSSCGITSLGFRKAATGARILEIAGGEASGAKADSLAKKLREALSEDLARIHRPMKCVQFRITGLDDSVGKEDVADAVAQHGGCPKEAVKVVGEIRRTQQGSGVVIASCPVAAAKKIGEAGRLLIGWVSARVEMLETRPMRCYRCLQNGHTRAMCTEEVDRSDECYRCGRPGHKSATCLAAPNCSICAAANKPSAHRLGGKMCVPPKSRRNRAANAPKKATSAATSCSPPRAGGVEEEISHPPEMDVN